MRFRADPHTLGDERAAAVLDSDSSPNNAPWSHVRGQTPGVAAGDMAKCLAPGHGLGAMGSAPALD
jgi:hypothetical protein